jgi:predicted DsbA family dithiol-disulfide isomerase
MHCEIIPKLGIIRVTKRISTINHEGLIIHDESWFVQCVLLLKGFTSMQFLPLHFARFLGISVLVSLMGVFPSLVAAESNELRPYTNNPVVAIVDDEPVILEDVKNAQIHEAMVQLYQMQSQALKEKILDKLVKNHPELKLTDAPLPSKDDVARFYANTPGIKEMGTLEKMRDEITVYLEKVYARAYVDERYQLAINKGWAKVYLKAPLEFRLKAQISTAMLWSDEGDPSSRRVFLLEYSDFQCPFCKRVQATLDQLREQYSKEVQFGYRHFPLEFHKEAKYMAESVECARDQGKFWELQRLLYDNSDPVSRTNLHQFAKKAGVKNIRRFQTCLKERKYKDRVLNDLSEGMKLGIRGTPTFILGTYDPDTRTVYGELLSGAVSLEKFKKVVEKYLSILRAEANLVR